MTPLDRAIATFPNIAAFASAIGVAASAPSMWKKRGNVPAEHCPAIEEATRAAGDTVLCEELRPDVKWGVVRSSDATQPALFKTDSTFMGAEFCPPMPLNTTQQSRSPL